jgi:hypothetical protein
MAFLDGVCRAYVGTLVIHSLPDTLDHQETLVASVFRKISRVGSFIGGTRWYLSDDCLLAARRSMYVVEYRRFYLRDLESIAVWPSRSWPLRPIIPGVVLGVLGASLWIWVNSTAGMTFMSLALAWVLLELALGPTAKSRITATGGSIELRVVKRTRRARKVLAKIDAAVLAARTAEQPVVPAMVAKAEESSTQTRSEAPLTATQTNAS